MIPTSMPKITTQPVNLADPGILKQEERKVDKAMELEQLAERQGFQRMMRRF
jgi:hypothetical protein